MSGTAKEVEPDSVDTEEPALESSKINMENKPEDDPIEETSEMSEIELLKSELEKTKQILNFREDELFRAKTDLSVLGIQARLLTKGEKLTDALEQRGELMDAKEAIQAELEDLTQKLFEEANNLVANEARQRHDVEAKVLKDNRRAHYMSNNWKRPKFI